MSDTLASTVSVVSLRQELRRFRATHGIRTWNQLGIWLNQPVRVMQAILHLRPIDASTIESMRDLLRRIPEPSTVRRKSIVMRAAASRVA